MYETDDRSSGAFLGVPFELVHACIPLFEKEIIAAVKDLELKRR
jgi:hypothetical protein